MDRAYLDNHATTRPLPSVRERVLEALNEGYGNPSSPTPRGMQARKHLEAARDAVARLVGADPQQVIFTSGCTEGNNIVLRRALTGPSRLIITATEHASVLEVADWMESQGVEVVRLSGSDGRIRPEDLRAALARPASLVSVQWANSETGVVQPIEAVARICQEAGVPLHVDAAQAVGRLPIAFDALGIDLLTFSGHKIHAPPGVGAICARDRDRVPRVFHGGDQEGGARAGTENLPGIVGLGAACAARHEDFDAAVAHMRQLRGNFEAGLRSRVPEAMVNGADAPRVCNTANIRFPVDGQALVAQLAAAGIACSQTSACSSRSPEPSKVLTLIGLSREAAFASVRFSFSVMNCQGDVDIALASISEVCQRLREFETL